MPESTIQALNALPNSILICGGMNKNLDYSELAKFISQKAKEVYFLEGDATDEISSQLSAISYQQDRIKGTYTDLEKLLEDIKKRSRGGEILFSFPQELLLLIYFKMSLTEPENLMKL